MNDNFINPVDQIIEDIKDIWKNIKIIWKQKRCKPHIWADFYNDQIQTESHICKKCGMIL